MVAYKGYNGKVSRCIALFSDIYNLFKEDVGLIHSRRLSKDNSVATNDVAQVRKDKKSYRENDRVLNRWREKFI